MNQPNKKLRRPPYYCCFGSDLMNDERYYLLTAAQRGLFDSIRNACWSNDSVPADPIALAVAVRLTTSGLEGDLAAVVKSGLVAPLPSASTRLHVPELVEQMQGFLERREQNAANAAKGGRATQQKQREARTADTSSDRSTRRSSDLKCNDVNCDDVTGSALKGVYREEPIITVDELPIDPNPADDHDDFLREYAEHEAHMESGTVRGRPSRSRADTAH